MAINPENPKQYKRLREAMRYSRRKLGEFRRHRMAAIRQYVGKHYGQQGDNAPDKVPINFLALAINIYKRHLVARTPAVLTTTEYGKLKPSTARLGLALDHLLKEIDFGHTMEMLVLDAMFQVGIMKIGLEANGELALDDQVHDIGTPFVDWVDLDDAVWDMGARHFTQLAYIGNRYRLPLDVVKDSDLFKGRDKDELQGSETLQDEEGGERVETLSRGSDHEADRYEDQIDLWDIYLPRENLMLTCVADQEDIDPIVREWSGPERGPYRLLGFADVPAQVMPMPPVALWMDVHELANELYLKLGRQAERQKEIDIIQSGSEMGELIKNASDGEMIKGDPGAVGHISTGGVNAKNLAFFMQTRDLFNWLSGNIESLGGLGPQSETLGQDELLSKSASKVVEDLQDRTFIFTRDAVEDLAWYLWHDPLIEIPLVQRIEGTNIDLPVLFSPETREGDFLQRNISIVPYSMQYMSPAERLRVIMQTMQGLVFPGLQMLEAQGGVIKFDNLLRVISKYSNVTELNDIVEFPQTEATQQPVGERSRPRQAPVTTRQNVRVNRPGGTRQGRDAAMMNLLLGGGVQDSEGAAIANLSG